MKNIIFITFFILLFNSCAGYRTTKITTNIINVGDKKEFVLKKLGKPFKIDSKKGSDVLYYKEVVDVSNYTYILTTELTFENSILVKIEQKEEQTPDKLEIKKN